MSEHERAEIEFSKWGIIFPIVIFVVGVLMTWLFYSIIPGLAILGMILIISSTFALFIVLARLMGAKVIVEEFKKREKERKIEEILRKAGVSMNAEEE